MAFSCSRWLSLSGPQIGHWLINANLKCFLGGRGWAHYLGACEAEEILWWVTDSKANSIFAIR